MPDRDKLPNEEFPAREWIIPQVGSSPVTGVQGTLFWGGINRPDYRSRWVIGDADLDGAVNFMPQGVQLQQVPYKGANIATLAATAIWQTTEFINQVPYLFFLCSNGHIYQVSTAGVITDVNAAGGFATSPPCDIANWQGSTIIICDPAAQNIYSWTGTTFATVFTAVPNTHVQVFQGRLWIFNNLSITWTQGNTFNSLAGDAGSAVISDNDADSPINRAFVFAGSLYLIGADWIKTIYGLQDVGSPAVLIFSITGLLSQVGVAANPGTWSVIAYGSGLYFANPLGVWLLSGTTPTKISSQMDGFFANLTLANTSFAAAYGQLFQTPCLFWQLYYNGDLNIPAGYYLAGVTLGGEAPGQWFMISMGTITWISGVEAWSGNALPTVWACDGTHVFQLFSNNTTSFQCQFITKIWDVNGSKIDKKSFERLGVPTVFTSASSVTVQPINEYGNTVGPALVNSGGQAQNPTALIWLNNSNQVMTWQNNASATITWQSGAVPTSAGYYVFQFRLGWTSRGIGFNITTQGVGVIIQSLILGYRETRGSWGPP